MGRSAKSIMLGEEIDRRESGYYSTPSFVADFMAKELLRINPDAESVLDPCTGKEELIGHLQAKGLRVDSFDLEDFDIHHNSNFKKVDFLEFYASKKHQCILSDRINLEYDLYIANPPYNCHEVEYISNNKNVLKKLFPDIGVHNMYSMFVSAMIDCAKDGALIAFITLDSFLTARAHCGLRKQIHDECSIHLLALCPTDLFWDQKSDVRTCIMILQKGRQYQGKVSVSNRPLDSSSFETILNDRELQSKELTEILLSSDYDSDEFVIGCPADIWRLFTCPRLGQIFKCVTGISTGNDKKYLSPEKMKGFEIPFYKNPGNDRFYTEPNGYLTNDFLSVDKDVPNFMVRNKDILFEEGITCSSMGVTFTACYLPPNCTFGVNANIICSKNDIWWLMGYLNSSLVTYMVRGILLRSNMITSGYVSRIPIVQLDQDAKDRIAAISKEAYLNRGVKSDYAVKKIDELLFSTLHICEETQKQISVFCNDVIRYT